MVCAPRELLRPMTPRSQNSEAVQLLKLMEKPSITVVRKDINERYGSWPFMYLIDDYSPISSYSEYLYLAPLYFTCTYLIA